MPEDAASASATSSTPARIGCAGWSIPSQHSHLFGPGDSVLARYATRFNAVEINSSFYRPHQRKTYERWAAAVPADFRFSVKVPKQITHELALRRCAEPLDQFVDEVTGLGGKLGGLLVQLPGSQVLDARAASNFFTMLRRRLAVAEIACEPRHASWFGATADALWHRQGVSRAAADPARVAEALDVAGNGGWHYWRWHGSPRMYYSPYDDSALADLAGAVRAATAGTPVEPWIIFDNTAHGHATTDAARLQALLARD